MQKKRYSSEFYLVIVICIQSVCLLTLCPSTVRPEGLTSLIWVIFKKPISFIIIIFFFQFSDLEPMLDDDEDPLATWLTLKPPSEVKSEPRDSAPLPPPSPVKEEQQFYIVGADGKENHCSVDEFFTSVDDSQSSPPTEATQSL